MLACGNGGEGAIEALPQNDGFAEGALGFSAIAGRAGPQAGGQLRQEEFRLLRERYQIGIAVKVFGAALRKMAVAYGVGEIEAKRSTA
jgi:hypothetical protein